MTGKNINSSVNRAFLTLGVIFFIGGLYLGTLLYLNAPEIYTVSGLIKSVRVEKTRPLGFENIPVDSSDPAHQNIPLSITTYGVIVYEFNSRNHETEILSWDEENDWKAGDERTFFLIEGEEDIPWEELPGDVGSEKNTAILIGLAASITGLIFSVISIYVRRKEKKAARELIKTVNELKKRNYQPMISPSGRILFETKNKGNILLGSIVLAVGLIFLGVGLSEILNREELSLKLMLAFPALIGPGLIYMGGSEFTSDTVTINSQEVRLVHKALWGRFNRREKISSFAGIDENLLEREVPGSIVRHIYREQVLIHVDPRFNDLSIKLIPDDSEAHGEALKLAKTLGLPRILRDGAKIRLEYPEGTVLKDNDNRDGQVEPWNPAEQFPGKHLSLRLFNDEQLLISRSYTKALVPGIIILAGGITLTVVLGTAAVLFPFGMIGLILTGFGLKSEIFEIRDGVLSLKRSVAGKTYRLQKMPLSEIRDIKSGHDPRMNNEICLEIISNKERILFGHSAPPEEQEWLKGCLEYMRTLNCKES